MSEDIAVLRDALAAVINVCAVRLSKFALNLPRGLQPILKKVQGAGFLKNGNVAPTMLHPYRCQSTAAEMRKARALGSEGHIHEQSFVNSMDEVILYVNNLGGMSTLEMSAIVDEVVQQLGECILML